VRQTPIRVDKNVPMEMRDGVVLRADVYRPDDQLKHPAILMRTPYNKNVYGDNGQLRFIEAASAGYAMVNQDLRGRFASEGTYDGGDLFFTVEGPDGYDSIEWLASQPWCDGNVGMAGYSYMGYVQFMAAKENPPHLKAIAPWMCGRARNETTLLEGIINLIPAFNSGVLLGMDIADKLEKEGKDVSEMRRMLNRAMQNPEEVYTYLPLKDVPHFNFEGVRELWQARLMIAPPEIAQKAVWPYEKITVPCFHMASWYDITPWSTIYNFLTMREKGGSERARQGQHLLMGPWVHGEPRSAVGDLHFGMLAEGPGAGISAFTITYFDKYLKEMDVNLPIVRYFIMGKNIWQNAEDWPLPQTQWQRFFLHSRGQANSQKGNGLLSPDEPGPEPPDIFVYNPYFPVPTIGGTRPGNGFVGGPIEQSIIERRHDVLCYTTPELKEDVEVTGPLNLHLFAAISTRDTDFTAKLIDVYPDGRAYNVAEGIIRGRYRNSVARPELVTPGEVNEYIINMANTSQLFRKGHRIRIDVASSNFPAFDRNMNTGNPVGEDAYGIPAMQTVYHQTQYASYLDIPVIPPSANQGN
jgi:uncharacterized protein